MRIVYGLGVLLEAILIAHCAIGSFKKHDRLGKSVCIYETLTFACAIVFFVFTFVPGHTVTVLAKGLTMALFDWMLIALMFYTQYYTGAVKTFKGVQAASMIFAVLDTYMLIENTWTNKIFDIESIKAENIKVVFNNDSLWYRLHFIFTYAFVILIIFTYLYMIIKSSRMYREAYGAIAVVIFIGFSFDIATIGSDSIYDLTMIIYGAIAIIIYYLTYRYVPNELIENMLSLVVRDMNNGIICYDRKGRCIYYNDLMEAIYRHGGNMSVYESKYSQWIEKLGDDRRDSMTFQTTDIEINGEKHYFEIAYKRIYDESNRVICDYFVYNDRTQMYESWEQEKYKASHDSLTGLLNRDQFYEDVHDMVNKYHDTTFYLICSNIKDFKFINEIFGMEKGNQVLIKQAKLMASNPSERTICARLMNDRFALCLPREEFDEKRVADSIKELQREFSGNSFHLHTYMGVYEIRDRDEAVSIMVDKANIAADTIKNNYDCCVAYYDEHLLEISIEQRRLLGEFEPALQNDEFVMYLQPQVKRDGAAKGAEALVRWMAPIMSFTADEIWGYLPGDREKYVFTGEWYEGLFGLGETEAMNDAFWDELLKVRGEVNKVIEQARADKKVGGSLEAAVTLYAEPELAAKLTALGDELRFVLLTSGAKVADYAEASADAQQSELLKGLKVALSKADGEKCPRCWHYTTDIGKVAEHADICGRCVSNVAGDGEKRKFA